MDNLIGVSKQQNYKRFPYTKIKYLKCVRKSYTKMKF